MKRLLFMTSVLVCVNFSSAADDGGPIPLEAYGVWDRGTSFDFEDYPFLKGLTFDAKWEEIEPEPGEFDFDGLDAAARKAHEHDRFSTPGQPGSWSTTRARPK